MSYSPLQRGTAKYMQLPLQYQQDSQPVFPAAQFISSVLHFTRVAYHGPSNSSGLLGYVNLCKPTGGPDPQVAIVRRHAHDSLLTCIQSLLSEPGLSLLCFPFSPCSAGCRMRIHIHMQLQNGAQHRTPRFPASLHTSPSFNFPFAQKRTTVRSQSAS
jgi:hypothetical protein